jgi:hypothetical protein
MDIRSLPWFLPSKPEGLFMGTSAPIEAINPLNGILHPHVLRIGVQPGQGCPAIGIERPGGIAFLIYAAMTLELVCVGATISCVQSIGGPSAGGLATSEDAAVLKHEALRFGPALHFCLSTLTLVKPVYCAHESPSCEQQNSRPALRDPFKQKDKKRQRE